MTNTEAKNPLVSIIVPTYNSVKTLEACLKSIRSQTYQNIELIVVDNNSADETKEIARKYTGLVFNKGPERNAQRVYAVGQSKGTYLCFIDSDMELSPSLVESGLRKCEQDGFDAMVLPEISVGDGFWADCRKLEKLCILNDEYKELANRFIKRDVYFAIGGYDCNEDWIGGEDYDIHERIKNAGYRIGRVSEFIEHHEIVPFGKMFSKYRIYGKYVAKHVRAHPKTGMRQFFIIHPAYLRNWKLFVKDPVHGIGLIIMKLSQYTAGGIGIISSLWDRKSRRSAEEFPTK